jgi:dephospho-CoA kinase
LVKIGKNVKMGAKKIAVTGGLSSGKSTVCQLFKELGAHVVDADEIVHRLLKADAAVARGVVELFGVEILTLGEIDRSKVAKKAFDNRILLNSLEKLLHPLVYDEIEKEYRRYSTRCPLFVAEVPLLFETEGERNFIATVAVKADAERCKERCVKCTKIEDEEYRRRAARQLSAEEKAARATYVIDNNFSLDELKVAVAELYQLLARS